MRGTRLLPAAHSPELWNSAVTAGLRAIFCVTLRTGDSFPTLSSLRADPQGSIVKQSVSIWDFQEVCGSLGPTRGPRRPGASAGLGRAPLARAGKERPGTRRPLEPREERLSCPHTSGHRGLRLPQCRRRVGLGEGRFWRHPPQVSPLGPCAASTAAQRGGEGTHPGSRNALLADLAGGARGARHALGGKARVNVVSGRRSRRKPRMTSAPSRSPGPPPGPHSLSPMGTAAQPGPRRGSHFEKTLVCPRCPQQQRSQPPKGRSRPSADPLMSRPGAGPTRQGNITGP